jgi:hypothetical protein
MADQSIGSGLHQAGAREWLGEWSQVLAKVEHAPERQDAAAANEHRA